MRGLTLLVFGLVLVSCNQPKEKEEEVEVATILASATPEVTAAGDFAHTVYFWLNNPESEEDRAAFLTSLNTFISNQPQIITSHIGIPADTSRGVIDNSYTFSLLLTFKDKADQDIYQEDPAHLLFISESNELWSKVVVYDSEVIAID